MARINISVPDDLKEKMDAIENLNWSAVAAQAFELETRRHQRITEMEQESIVDRLRASYEKHFTAEYDKGHEAGVNWASGFAEANELIWLEENRDDAVDVLLGQTDRHMTPFMEIGPKQFWLWHVQMERMPTRTCAEGFVVGAVEVWKKVEDDVRSKV